MSLLHIPEELKTHKNWVGWKWEQKNNSRGVGNWTKPPYDLKSNGTLHHAETNNPATWSAFEAAEAEVSSFNPKFDGVGFVLPPGLGGVDFDGVIVGDKPEPFVLEILKHLGSPYTEITPSNNGLRAFFNAPTLPADKRRKFHGKKSGVDKYGAEIYFGVEPGRYLTVTGQRFSGDGLSTPLDIDLVQLLMSQIGNEKFKKLWMGDISDYGGDQSAADLALVSILARLLHDAARIEEYFGDSVLGQREKWTDRPDYRERTIAKALSGADPSNYVEVNSQEVKIPVDERPDMPRSVLSGRLGEICEKNMLDDFPVSYAWPSLVTAASVLVPERIATTAGGDNLHNIYTALVGPVNCGKSQAIEWAMNLLRLKDDPRQYSEVKPGSAERLLKYMNHLRETGQLGSRVLMFLDEWKFFFDKAAIENSVFPTLLTTGFYRRNTTILDSHGRPLTVPASFSWIGGIVTDSYDDCLSQVTSLGLHDRLLQGINPSNYSGFNYRPFEGDVLPSDFTLKPVQIDKTVWDRLKEWRSANPQATREAEIAFRIAEICASFDGAPTLYGRDLSPHLLLALEQMKLRETLKPNIGETPDARCAIKVENYLKSNGPAGEWLDLRVMMKAIHYERFGPNAFKRTIDGLEGLKIVETDGRGARSGNLPGGRPAKVIRLVPE